MRENEEYDIIDDEYPECNPGSLLDKLVLKVAEDIISKNIILLTVMSFENWYRPYKRFKIRKELKKNLLELNKIYKKMDG